MKSDEPSRFEQRKKDHIKWSLDSMSQADQSVLSQVSLIHHALPDLDFKDISISPLSEYFKNSKPLMVSSMTGGFDNAYLVNQTLLKACVNNSWIFACGSLRRELDEITDKKSNFEYLNQWIELLKPSNCPVIGNLGVAQVIEHDPKDIASLCEKLQLNGIYIHLNALQEVMQPEGTPSFKGGAKAIKELVQVLDIPVFIKETGSGFSESSLKALKDTGVKAIDVSGFGGTHWGRVEGLRSTEKTMLSKASKTFENWGVSTVDSLINFKNTFGEDSSVEAWSSGGLRSGLDAAISFALGAKVCGFAKPFMEAALLGDDAVQELMELIEFELKTALFCTNTDSLKSLINKKDVLKWN